MTMEDYFRILARYSMDQTAEDMILVYIAIENVKEWLEYNDSK